MTIRRLLPRFVLVLGGLILAGCDGATGPGDAPDLWVDVGTGNRHACGLKASGQAFCWGWNFQGQIGDASLEDRLVPTPVRGGPGLRSIEVAGDRACGLDQDGAAWCWGDNDQGEIGDGRGGLPAVVPTPVAGGHRFRALSLGVYMGCGLEESGEAWCWGGDRFRNLLPLEHGYACPGAYAQLAWICFAEPVRPHPGVRFQSIAVGLFHICGVDLDGVAICWGSNRYTELGIDGGAEERCVSLEEASSFDIPCATIPTPVGGAVEFAEIRAGGIFTCGLDGGGSAYCWGANRFNNGQLGTGTLDGSRIPRPVFTTRAFVSIVPSTENSIRATTCAVDEFSAGLCWGSNDLGQTGSPNSTPCYRGLACALRPAEVSGGLRFRKIDPASTSTCGVTVEGGLYCWGGNSLGQLGDGTMSDRAAPGPVVDPS